MAVQVLQGAVCPEVKLGLDDAVSAIASVTEVAVSNDLQVAKVYISVYSDPEGRAIAMRGLSRLEGYALGPFRFSCYVHVKVSPATGIALRASSLIMVFLDPEAVAVIMAFSKQQALL